MKANQFQCVLFFLFTGTLMCQAQIGGGNQGFTPDYAEYHANYVPVTPNASSFTVYGNTPVNHATGVPQISIPIFTVVEDGVSIPISLSYDASGIMVDELASAVGLKWRLNAGGGIFRQVNDKADEVGWLNPQHRGYIDADWFNNNTFDDRHTQVYVLDDSAQNDDYFPDDFSYNFGGYSGAFIYDQNGNLAKEYQDHISIERINAVNQIPGFITKDGMGNTYFFNDADAIEINSTNVGTSGDGSVAFNLDSGANISGWMMNKIQTKNNKEILLEYENYNMQYTIFNVSNSITQINGCQPIDPRSGLPSSNETYCGCLGEQYLNNTHLINTSIYYTPQQQLIKTITSPTVQVTFHYADDTSLSTWQKKLTSISILDRLKNKTKSFVFTYGTYTGDARLRLDRVQEIGFDGLAKPPYVFTYETGALPSKGSTSKDFSGYYNGKTNGSLVPVSAGAQGVLNSTYSAFLADRTPDLNFLKIGTLKTIEYPTGGTTDFSFGVNVNANDVNHYTGGLRVSSIIDKDADGTQTKRTNYSYQGLQGYSLGSNLGATRKDYGLKKVFSSDNLTLNPVLIRSGYYYDEVTIEQIGNGETLRTVEKYEGKFRNKSRDSRMVRQEFYRDDFLVKSVDLEYTGTTGEVQYYVLGDKDQCFFYSILSSGNSNGPSTAHLINYLGYGTSYLSRYYLHTEELSNRKEIDYFGDTTDPFSASIKISRYDYNDQLLPIRQELDGRYYATSQQDIDSDNLSINTHGEHLTIEYTYPQNHSTQSTQMNGFVNDHYIALPVSKKVYDKTNLIQGQYAVFDTEGNVVETYRYNKGQGSNSYGTYIPADYEFYGSYILDQGKPAQITMRDDIPTAVLWDATRNHVLAQLINVTKAQLDAVQSPIDLSVTTNAQLGTLYQNLRTAFPNAMVSTFIHDPLKGLVTQTDARGYSTTFEYDGLSRLTQVKDADGFILSQNNYHYKGQ
ncbi:RHS repeat protein [Spongiimicrobium salis]|uniref:RHS repeat protein n=1 Tax=Spongiimicrobium salis TaxID=1667022 RepID=UPI00374CD9C5